MTSDERTMKRGRGVEPFGEIKKRKMQKERDESFRAVVVAQLVERLLLTPEICGSNPDISTI